MICASISPFSYCKTTVVTFHFRFFVARISRQPLHFSCYFSVPHVLMKYNISSHGFCFGFLIRFRLFKEKSIIHMFPLLFSLLAYFNTTRYHFLFFFHFQCFKETVIIFYGFPPSVSYFFIF